MVSKNLSEIINSSFILAKNRNSEYLTVDHLFLAILLDEAGNSFFSDFDIPVKDFINMLEDYLEKTTQVVENPSKDYAPVQSVALNRVFNDMLFHVESSGKKEATVSDLIVSLFVEEKSYSVQLLEKNGIDKLEILEYVTEIDKPEEKDDISTNSETDFNNSTKTKKDEKSLLDKYTTNLNILALEGKIDPLIGRDNETDQIIRTLLKRKKNNPMLVGEAGVGKTAMIEGLALDIINKTVPEMLLDCEIYSIDMGNLVAGTKFRGEFEKRFKGVMEEIAEVKNPILFIDEIHNIIGAGSASGSMDASNLLKPILTAGDIKCIGTTTYSEYKKFFDKEKALSRRFEKIDISEPSKELTYDILQGLKKNYEDFHKVKYEDEALKKAIDLSVRFINNRFLPDKAIDIMDETGADIQFSNSKKEKNNKKSKRKVNSKDIEKIISKKLNIPSKTINNDDKKGLKNLEISLKSSIFGQDTAIEQLVTSIKRNKAGLSEEEKPIGSFLFTGPSGVGKTAVTKELANSLSVHFARFDMSEYMEKHTVSRLIGAPAGYVGYEEGGLLTETIRKNPYCVLLLDEIEKAHVDVLNVLLQIMDNSTLTDTTGIKVNFKNVILIMTSNLGSKEAKSIGFNKDTSLKTDTAVKKFFSPEFRNRLDSIVEFNSLNKKIMSNIVVKFIKELENQLSEKKIQISISKTAIEYLSNKGYSEELGARPLARIIQEEIKNPLTDEILFGKLSGKNGGKVNVGLKKGDLELKYWFVNIAISNIQSSER